MQDPFGVPSELSDNAAAALSQPFLPSQDETELQELLRQQQQQLQQQDDDFMHELLAMNTLAMQRCAAEMLDEASTILSEAYMKLHNCTGGSGNGGDPVVLDSLRATTLNNLGVVESHRGQHRQALSHFEAARQLEEKRGVASPAVALNSCAAYNALRMFDKSTAAAMETIDMLRNLALQKKNAAAASAASDASRKGTLHSDAPRHSIHHQQQVQQAMLLPSETLAGVQVAESDNRALWGAAWHNLAVAQINTARSSREPSEHSNATVMIQNAMRATRELLGPDHPMTHSVTETYRAVRDALRSHGVYRQHRTLCTAPPRPVDPRDVEDEEEEFRQRHGTTRRQAMKKFYGDLTITFRGEVTDGATLTERLDATPYPGAKDAAFRSARGNRPPNALRCMALSETLVRAGMLYGNPHPLLTSLPPNYTSPASTLNQTHRSNGGQNLPSGRAAPPPRPRRLVPSPQSSSVFLSNDDVAQREGEEGGEETTRRQRQSSKRLANNAAVRCSPRDEPQPLGIQYTQAWAPNAEKKRHTSAQAPRERYQQHQQQQQRQPQPYSQRQKEQKQLQRWNDPQKAEYDERDQQESYEWGPQRKSSPRTSLPPLNKKTIADRQMTSNESKSQRAQDEFHQQRQKTHQQSPFQQQKQPHRQPQQVAAAPPEFAYEQVKYVLLANPILHSDTVTSSQAAAPKPQQRTVESPNRQKSREHHQPSQQKQPKQPQCNDEQWTPQGGTKQKPMREAKADEKNTRTPPDFSRSPITPAGDWSGQTASCPPAVSAADESTGAHRLFDAMWVATKADYEEIAKRRNSRIVGKPSYFVSSTVDLAKEDADMPEHVTQMMVESSTSMEDSLKVASEEQ